MLKQRKTQEHKRSNWEQDNKAGFLHKLALTAARKAKNNNKRGSYNNTI